MRPLRYRITPSIQRNPPKHIAELKLNSANFPKTRFVKTASKSIIKVLILSAVARSAVVIALFCSSVPSGDIKLKQTRMNKTPRTETNGFSVKANRKQEQLQTRKSIAPKNRGFSFFVRGAENTLTRPESVIRI